MNSRRKFIKNSGALGLAVIAAQMSATESAETFSKMISMPGKDPFTLPALPYAYDALEPFIDKQTMEIHHSRHHQAYVNKLNETPSTNIDYLSNDAVKCSHVDKFTSMTIRNNLGGHYNHSLFWTLLQPNPNSKENNPEGNLAAAIKKQFSTLEEFKKQFTEAATKHFGSGWCWLIEQNNKLKITTTPNQDNPLMKLDLERGKIILALDVWEHAYYLKYQNKRADYISNWWNVVNWNKAETLFNSK